MGGMLGGGEGESSSQSTSSSGYNAMPAIEQAGYDPFFTAITNLWNQTPYSAPAGAYSNYNMNANNPFYSQGLGALQAANPNMGMNPTGFLEPFNQYQQNALSAYGNPNPSDPNFLSPYMNPYNSQVKDATLGDINRQADIGRSNIMDNSSRINSRALGSSLGTQLAGNEEGRMRAIGDASANLNYQGYNSGLDLRNNLLGQQLASGSAIQSQNQQALGIANPINYLQSLYKMDPTYAQASALSPFYQYFPQAQQQQSSSEGTTGGGSNGLSQALGFGMSLFG